MIDAAVALLQRDPTLDSLEVVEHGLGLDRHDPADASDERVPSSPITLDRKRHFGPPDQSPMKPRPKPFEKPLLAGVPDRIAGRVCPEPDVKPDDGSVRSELADRRAAGAGLKSFDA